MLHSIWQKVEWQLLVRHDELRKNFLVACNFLLPHFDPKLAKIKSFFWAIEMVKEKDVNGYMVENASKRLVCAIQKHNIGKYLSLLFFKIFYKNAG